MRKIEGERYNQFFFFDCKPKISSNIEEKKSIEKKRKQIYFFINNELKNYDQKTQKNIKCY